MKRARIINESGSAIWGYLDVTSQMDLESILENKIWIGISIDGDMSLKCMRKVASFASFELVSDESWDKFKPKQNK